MMTKTNSVITIGRQYGSGGHVVGEKLAEMLGIPYYDKAILTEAAKNSGICEELFEQNDEKPNRSLLFSLVNGTNMHTGDMNSMYMGLPLNHQIFLAQFDAIRKVADQGPCVIVGRCADYVLRDHPSAVSVFIKADLPSRVARAIERGADPMKAEEIVRKQDKQRAAYYNYYATGTWGSVDNYDLIVDTAKLGIDGSAELLAQYILLRERQMMMGKI